MTLTDFDRTFLANLEIDSFELEDEPYNHEAEGDFPTPRRLPNAVEVAAGITFGLLVLTALAAAGCVVYAFVTQPRASLLVVGCIAGLGAFVWGARKVTGR